MVKLTEENALLDEPGDRGRHWISAREEIADHGAVLSRTARRAFPGARGDIALGIIGQVVPPLSQRRPSVLEHICALAGLELSSGTFSHLFYLTALGRSMPGVSR